MTSWPCDTCGDPGIRNVGARGYCAPHLSELYRRFNPQRFAPWGIGLIAGPRQHDGAWGLICGCCDATWVGAPFTDCPWCVDRHLLLVEHQADLLEQAADNCTDIEALIKRLAVAVQAGVIDLRTAERLTKRATRAAAA